MALILIFNYYYYYFDCMIVTRPSACFPVYPVLLSGETALVKQGLYIMVTIYRDWEAVLICLCLDLLQSNDVFWVCWRPRRLISGWIKWRRRKSEGANKRKTKRGGERVRRGRQEILVLFCLIGKSYSPHWFSNLISR